MSQRLLKLWRLFPSEILFIHRDAEREDPVKRIEEIESALDQVDVNMRFRHNIPVIPVRMSEAWLLISERAIR